MPSGSGSGAVKLFFPKTRTRGEALPPSRSRPHLATSASGLQIASPGGDGISALSLRWGASILNSWHR